MFSLLLKDVLILKKQFLLAIVYIAAMNFFLAGNLGAVLVPGLTVALTYLLIVQSCAIDDKSNSELALLSLPLLRRDIVQAKYLTLFLYALLSMLCFPVLQFISTSLGHPAAFPLTWGTFAAAILAVSLMGSVYYPFYFKLGYVKSRFIATLFFFTIFFAPSLLLRLLKHPSQSSSVQALARIFQWLSGQSEFTLSISALLLAALLSSSSYFLSMWFYQRREF